MKMKIVADSSSDLLSLDGVAFASAPLKIITAEKEYVDDAELDVEAMVDDLLSYNGKSSTSCPNPEDWLSAFGDAKEVFCITITSSLSGSYNSACIAKKMYEEKDPANRVFVIDSLSTGPEMTVIIQKLEELILEGKSFDEIKDTITSYQKHTRLLFMLESMKNLANNGRVSKLSAKFAGMLGIRLIGKASDVGTLEPLDKVRGQRATLARMLERLEELGYKGGRLHIAHCLNAEAANEFCEMVREKFKKAEIKIRQCGALCSFYAEKGGMLVGFEIA